MTATLSLDSRLTVSPRCLLTELPDGTGVVLDLDDKAYFTLNRTAVFVWHQLEQGQALADVADALVLEFRVEHDEARTDVLALAAELTADGLLRNERAP